MTKYTRDQLEAMFKKFLDKLPSIGKKIDAEDMVKTFCDVNDLRRSIFRALGMVIPDGE